MLFGKAYLPSTTRAHANIASNIIEINIQLVLGTLDAGDQKLFIGDLRRHLDRAS